MAHTKGAASVAVSIDGGWLLPSVIWTMIRRLILTGIPVYQTELGNGTVRVLGRAASAGMGFTYGLSQGRAGDILRLLMKPRIALALLLGLFAVLFSSSSAIAAGIDKSAQDLVKRDADWSNAAVKKDVDLLVSFYTEDTVLYSPNDPLSVGKDAARKFWVAGFADPLFSVSWKVVNASVAKSGELGFTTGTYELTFKGPDGKPATDKGKYVTIWTRGPDGIWKVAHDIFNSDLK